MMDNMMIALLAAKAAGTGAGAGAGSGTPGAPGKDGKDGKNAYVRFSAYADGTGFTESWTSGQNYVGFATDYTAPTDKAAYVWCRFIPEAGAEEVKTAYASVTITDFSKDSFELTVADWDNGLSSPPDKVRIDYVEGANYSGIHHAVLVRNGDTWSAESITAFTGSGSNYSEITPDSAAAATVRVEDIGGKYYITKLGNIKRIYDGSSMGISFKANTFKVTAWYMADLDVADPTNARHYTVRWDKINAAMTRLNDAAHITTDTTNFGHFGSVNANYNNPFDKIYPWSGIRLCNIDIDLYRNLAAGDSITKCVKAWEGDTDFSYEDVNGVWRYRPEFYGKSWEDETYRYFDVTERATGSYVHYPEAIVGRWCGRAVTLTVGEAEKTCLVPSVGMPTKRIAMSALHTYAKNYGATIDSIFSIDADVLLCIVEFATMNTQKAIGNGVSNLYRQSSDLIAEDATNSNVVKVLASAASETCIPGAIFDIGTSNGGIQVGSFIIQSVQANLGDAQYLDVTLNEPVTVTTANYWSVHCLANKADEEIGSKSGYIGTNGKCNSYYRGIVLFGNFWFYTLGAYENHTDQHIWIANSDEEADNYDALNTSVHYDTGLVLPGSSGYMKKLGMLSRSGLLSIPAFCTGTGGDSNNPTGDYFYNGVYTYNTVLVRGGDANPGSAVGAFYGYWAILASYSYWSYAARPRLKNP